MKKLPMLFIVLAGYTASAQKNISQYVTNYIESQDYRELDGVTYNMQKSPLWKQKYGICEQIKKDGVVISTFTKTPIYKTYIPSGNSDGNFLGSGGGGGFNYQVGTKRVNGPRIFLINPPAGCTTDKEITFVAMQKGIVEIDGMVLEQWDRGKIGKMMVVSESQEYLNIKTQERLKESKLKALAFNQSAADRGDAYGQFRMGERYRDGDGVEKNAKTAEEYFRKSASQGNKDAESALKNLVTKSN